MCSVSLIGMKETEFVSCESELLDRTTSGGSSDCLCYDLGTAVFGCRQCKCHVSLSLSTWPGSQQWGVM